MDIIGGIGTHIGRGIDTSPVKPAPTPTVQTPVRDGNIDVFTPFTPGFIPPNLGVMLQKSAETAQKHNIVDQMLVQNPNLAHTPENLNALKENLSLMDLDVLRECQQHGVKIAVVGTGGSLADAGALTPVNPQEYRTNHAQDSRAGLATLDAALAERDRKAAVYEEQLRKEAESKPKQETPGPFGGFVGLATGPANYPGANPNADPIKETAVSRANNEMNRTLLDDIHKATDNRVTIFNVIDSGMALPPPGEAPKTPAIPATPGIGGNTRETTGTGSNTKNFGNSDITIANIQMSNMLKGNITLDNMAKLHGMRTPEDITQFKNDVRALNGDRIEKYQQDWLSNAIYATDEQRAQFAENPDQIPMDANKNPILVPNHYKYQSNPDATPVDVTSHDYTSLQSWNGPDGRIAPLFGEPDAKGSTNGTSFVMGQYFYNDKTKTVVIRDSSIKNGTPIHEMGHAYIDAMKSRNPETYADFNKKSEDTFARFNSSTKSFFDSSNSPFVSDYARTNHDENFCESFKEYYQNPTNLKDKDEAWFNTVKDFIGAAGK